MLRVEWLERRCLLASDLMAVDSDVMPPQNVLGGSVSGVKWDDANGNGQREVGEPGLAGVTIYADLNNNHVFDSDEPFTTSDEDNPGTRVDESGRYFLASLPLGSYSIREVVPNGFEQTFPSRPLPEPPSGDELLSVEPTALNLSAAPGESLQRNVQITVHPVCVRPFEFDIVAMNGDEIGVPGVEVENLSGVQINGCGGDVSEFELGITLVDLDVASFELGIVDRFDGVALARVPVFLDDVIDPADGHAVTIVAGTFLDGLDFGNHATTATGTIEGRKWLDHDGNGLQDPGEPGLGGVDIYLDLNNNGKRDVGEPQTRTQYEDPLTDFDEGGLYSFRRVVPGQYVVREVVPEGYEQTFPSGELIIGSAEPGEFERGVSLAFGLTDSSLSQDGDQTRTQLEFTVQWPDGCGLLLPDRTTHTAVGNIILVNVHGSRPPFLDCVDVVTSQDVLVDIGPLEPGAYTVVATFHETGSDITVPARGLVVELQLESAGAHPVTVEPNSIASDVNFGNRRRGPAEAIRGLKWDDINGDGQRQASESGLGGVTIFADLDENGTFNEGEPAAVTSDGADGAVVGSYAIEGLGPGIYTVREIVPDGFRQTFPALLFQAAPTSSPSSSDAKLNAFGAGSYRVELRPGRDVEGVDFGNQSSEPGEVHGTKWNDVNGNARWDEGEPGLAGVTIYIDSNNNGEFDAGEPSAVTMEDDPLTPDVNELGQYWIRGVTPGAQRISEIAPSGFHQTFPSASRVIESRRVRTPAPFVPTSHFVEVLPGQTIEGVNFGNQETQPATIHGLTWNDLNDNGRREFNEPGLAGVTIYADLNSNGQLDEGEPRTVTMDDNPETDSVSELGRYWLEGLEPNITYEVREIVPDGFRQTFPELLMEDQVGDLDELGPVSTGQHFVFVYSGVVVEGINFANHRIAQATAAAGVKMGDADGDGHVTFSDFLRLVDNLGKKVDAVFADGDFNGDGVVSLADFEILIANFGV